MSSVTRGVLYHWYCWYVDSYDACFFILKHINPSSGSLGKQTKKHLLTSRILWNLFVLYLHSILVFLIFRVIIVWTIFLILQIIAQDTEVFLVGNGTCITNGSAAITFNFPVESTKNETNGSKFYKILL